HLPRARLATLPTPLERGPLLPGGSRLWVKRDDLTGLGMGGNKARKLEFLCGAAVAAGARSLVTVGAAQSNHCRMTAAAGSILGLDVHLVLSGDRPSVASGNQLLSTLFGAHAHFTGAEANHWGELEIAREALTDELQAAGAAPYTIPIGGSTAVGAVGYAVGFVEILEQCEEQGIAPAAIVHASSSGGTHAGLVAGRALMHARSRRVPEILAIGVAKGVNMGLPDISELAGDTVDLIGGDPSIIDRNDVRVDASWIGDDYAVPTRAGDAAIRWAARHGGWVLDRVYSGKGLAGLIGNAEGGRWPDGSDVVFIHTGGMPSLFAPGGVPD
ncbi:1-aminocyclopropane-1-carboxylate deaminase/D-cysteine desulfhydrase, partial [Ilumatobacter sp.]|uniref:1-aminocyclopropane-1-carboxylate deaminase/D-cysteine desulfhydrase n=1 Tax=Ilumatobacter sp. TaxID=1967498 RepID=UPI003AF7A3BD